MLPALALVCYYTTCYYLLPYYYFLTTTSLLTDRPRVLHPLIPGQHHSAPPDDLPTLPGYHPILGAARLRDGACVRARYLINRPILGAARLRDGACVRIII